MRSTLIPEEMSAPCKRVKNNRRISGLHRFDKQVIDGAVDGTGQIVKKTASILRRTQNGLVRTYALGIGIGAIGLLIWFLTRTTI